MERKLVYLDVMDTVRTNDILGDTAEKNAQMLAAGQLMLQLLKGSVPILAQAHVFDSAVILGASKHPDSGRHFRSLIEKGDIQLRLYNHVSILDAFEEALKNDSYIFSGWPEIRTKSTDRREVLEALRYPRTASKLPDSVSSRLETLKLLD